MSKASTERDGDAASLEALFEHYESLPARDAEETKRELVERMVAAVAARLAATGADERYRNLRDTLARLRLLAPDAPGFDDTVLGLIDDARETLRPEVIAEVVAPRPVPTAQPPRDDDVTNASEDSFPASDPPGFVADGGESR